MKTLAEEVLEALDRYEEAVFRLCEEFCGQSPNDCEHIHCPKIEKIRELRGKVRSLYDSLRPKSDPEDTLTRYQPGRGFRLYHPDSSYIDIDYKFLYLIGRYWNGMYASEEDKYVCDHRDSKNNNAEEYTIKHLCCCKCGERLETVE